MSSFGPEDRILVPSVISKCQFDVVLVKITGRWKTFCTGMEKNSDLKSDEY